jgi:outer membrane protein assembly factor BamD
MRGCWAGALAVALVVLGGCAGKKPVVPPEQLWSEADTAFNDEAYDYAVDKYKALLDQHPFDPRAEEAELKIAQSYYLARRYPEAIAAFADFERMHPTSPNLAQVEYQLGMSYLAQASTADRDQQAHTNALTYFRNLIDRFPQTTWAEKARLRMRECREALAKHESDIARYYLRRGNLRAAEARLRGLLTDYPDTDATAEALHDFAIGYAKRDEPEGANLALATLVRYHPDGPLGREAKEQLVGKSVNLDGQDPLPVLVGLIDRMRETPERQNVPRTVSAYPEIGGTSGGAR